MKQIILLLISLLSFGAVSAQTITGQVVDEKSTPMIGAVVALLQLPDSSMVSSELTDNSGKFQFNKHGDIIVVSYLGYKRKTLKTVNAMGVIQMEINPLQATEVTVTAAQAGLKQEGNRFILTSVYSSPFATGRGVLDFMKFAPLLNVTDNSISILGRKSATILINGRKTNMPYDDVIEMLKNMPAQDVEKIEILPTPGSSFRATEQDGVINVILRRGASEGVQATIKLEDNQRFYNGQSVATTINYNSKKVFLTSGVNFSNTPLYNELNSITDDYKAFKQINVTSEDHGRMLMFGGYLNTDIAISKRSTIGFNLRASFRDMKNLSNSTTSYLNTENALIDSTDNAHVDSRMPFINYNLSANLHYDYKTDDKGSLLKVDADYYNGNSKKNGYNFYDRVHSDNIYVPIESFMQSQGTVSNYYSFKTSYTHRFSEINILKTGIEVYGSSNNNNYFYGNRQGETYVSDPKQTNDFLYDEIVEAAFLEYFRIWTPKWRTIIGIRFEGSQSWSDQRTTNQKHKRSEFGIYPSVSVNYSPNKKHSITLDLNTAIYRPTFAMLNPFIQYISPTYYIENDPNIKPAKSYGAMLNYTFLKDYTFIADYSYMQNNWTEFRIMNDDGTIKEFRTNYPTLHSLSLTFQVTKRFFNNYLAINGALKASYRRDEGSVANNYTVNNTAWSFSARISANVTLSKKAKWNAQLRYVYQSPMQWAAISFNTTNDLSVSISKQFKKGHVLNLGVNNIVAPTWNKKHVYQPDYQYYSASRQTQYYWVGYTMRFGNNKTKNATIRNNINRME